MCVTGRHKMQRVAGDGGFSLLVLKLPCRRRCTRDFFEKPGKGSYTVKPNQETSL